MKDKFYIVRFSEDGKENTVFCVVSTLAAALGAIHDNKLHDCGAYVEFCRGCSWGTYEVYKTLFAKGRCSA